MSCPAPGFRNASVTSRPSERGALVEEASAFLPGLRQREFLDLHSSREESACVHVEATGTMSKELKIVAGVKILRRETAKASTELPATQKRICFSIIPATCDSIQL
ncbi:hypothetical protein GCM10007919_67410 [Rhizobium indigoferae]|nr:hypothetical protein GCM10007919_67410 [Rhizobium indigoferae]